MLVEQLKEGYKINNNTDYILSDIFEYLNNLYPKNIIFNVNKYESFISNMLGKIYGLYNFDLEKSTLFNKLIRDIDFSMINNDLNNNGLSVLKKKLDDQKINSIIDELYNIDFRPYQNPESNKFQILIYKLEALHPYLSWHHTY